MKKYILLLTALMAGQAAANDCNRCESSCESAPLEACQWGIVVKGGVTPTRRTEQGCVWLTNPCQNLSGPITGCNTTPPSPTSPVFSVSKTAKFKNQFKTPATFAVELQYALDGYHMIYLEYAYRHAKATPFPFTAGLFEVCETTNNYKSQAGYIGFRNYFNRMWCDKLSFFVGGKLGILHRNQICYTLNLATPSFNVPLTEIATNPYFFADNVVSAGLHIGFDYNFRCNWSFQFNVEVITSAGPKVNQNVVFGAAAGLTLPADTAKLTALGGLTNVNIGAVGTEVQFPITFGIRYSY